MATKEKIDYLLLDIRELEKQVAGIRDAEIYPVSFFSQAFELSRKILNDLHTLEAAQLDALRRQMEAHEQLIQSIPPGMGNEACDSPTTSEVQAVDTVPVPTTEDVVPSPSVPSIPEMTLPEVSAFVNDRYPESEEEKPSDSSRPEPLTAGELPVPAKVTEELPVKKEEASEAPSNPAKPLFTEKTVVSLNDVLEKQNLSDFRKAFSLNDRFRFRRELFGGDEERMNRAINDLNDLHSYEESVSYLHNELKWNIEDIAVADFLKLLEKRFS